MRSTRRYLCWLGTSFASLLMAGALLSLLIDPYRAFHVPGRLDDHFPRPRAAQQVRLTKTYGIAYVRPHTLVLGNSRAEIGFDPQSRAWPADWRPIYNAAIPGSSLTSDVRTLSHALQQTDVRHIVVGLEFLDFLTEPDAPLSDVGNGTSDDGAAARQRLQTLFSLDAVVDALLTLAARHEPDAADITAAGFNPLHEYRTYARREGYAALFQQREAESARLLARLPHDVLRKGERTSPSWRALDRLLALADQHDIEVELVGYPYHARLLELFRAAGLWPAFETWKRELASVVKSHPKLNGGGACALWDFSGYHAYARELVPPPGDHETEVPSYWEAGHFKPVLGERMLVRMLERRAASDEALGRCLTEGNVRTALQAIAAEREAYVLAAHAGVPQAPRAP